MFYFMPTMTSNDDFVPLLRALRLTPSPTSLSALDSLVSRSLLPIDHYCYYYYSSTLAVNLTRSELSIYVITQPLEYITSSLITSSTPFPPRAQA